MSFLYLKFSKKPTKDLTITNLIMDRNIGKYLVKSWGTKIQTRFQKKILAPFLSRHRTNLTHGTGKSLSEALILGSTKHITI